MKSEADNEKGRGREGGVSHLSHPSNLLMFPNVQRSMIEERSVIESNELREGKEKKQVAVSHTRQQLLYSRSKFLGNTFAL